MISQRAEKSFRKGRQLLDEGRPRDALAHLNAAITFDEKKNVRCKDGRYLSYYGFCLCLTRTDRRQALRLCREAVKREQFCHLIWWNLARVALTLGRHGEAYRALQHAFDLQPEHRGIERDLLNLGVRRPPVFSFLPRRHAVNVMLGKMRASMNKPLWHQTC